MTAAAMQRDAGREFNELVLVFELVTRCAGACQGCLFAADEKAFKPQWSDLLLRDLATFVRRFHDEHAAADPVDSMTLTFGLGDYLSLDPALLGRFSGWMRALATSLPTRTQPLISTSAVAPWNRFKQCVDAFDPSGDGLMAPPAIDLVFDPKKLRMGRFSQTYLRNIRLLRDRYAYVRLNMNLGTDTLENVTPAQMRRFVEDNGFSYVGLNLFPTTASAPQMAAVWPRITGWVEELLAGWGGYAEARNSIGISLGFRAGSVTREQLPAMLRKDLLKDLYFDASGNVYFQQIGFGDMPMVGKFGCKPAGTVRDMLDRGILPSLDAATRPLTATLAREFLVRQPCGGCPHNLSCAQSGVLAFKNTVAPLLPARADGGCPVHIDGVMAAVGDGASIRADFDKAVAASAQAVGRVPAAPGFDTRSLGVEVADA